MPTAEEFCIAFCQQWEDDVLQREDDIRQAYQTDREWTRYMLAGNGSFLERLSVRLPPVAGRTLTMGREWYTLDTVFYDEDTATFRPGGGGVYPDGMHVLVEHENGADVETEMWKLLMFRSPLKVLVFYDYPEDQLNIEARRMWLERKLDILCRMHVAVNNQCGEASNAEYLFLIGSAGPKGIPAWRYGKIDKHGWGGLHRW